GGGEHASGADVKLSRQSVRLSHRVALEGTGAALPGELDRGARKCVRDASSAEALAGNEAGHCPYAAVVLVLAPPLPGDTVVAEHARVRSARFDGAPADGLSVEVGNEAAGGLRFRPTAPGLLAEPQGVLRGTDVRPRLAWRHLEPLAPASGR